MESKTVDVRDLGRRIDAISSVIGIYFSPKVGSGFGDLSWQILEKRMSAPLLDAPKSLQGRTEKTQCRDQKIPVSGKFSDVFFKLGILGEKDGGTVANAPVVGMAARMLFLPSVVSIFFESGKAAGASFSDPPVLKMSASEAAGIMRAGNDIRVKTNGLEYNGGVIRLFADFAKIMAPFESPFCGFTSTDAYVHFTHFQLANREVRITSTTPGAILPSENNPVKWKVDGKEGDIARIAYFGVLQDAPEATKGNRSYFADVHNTRRALAAQDRGLLLESANLVTHYEKRGVRIRVGEVAEELRHATLVSSQGVVYSVRDTGDKRAVHNYTVYSKEEAGRYSGVFAGQWSGGKPFGRNDVYSLADEGRTLTSGTE